ncbi:unnamed protein product [Sphenostylis stenocarpa]|uniref:Uncharacterized protein n=1 Tax=Sphenostylis stenocarpa TaxID=92480 RepID=A0AA86SAE7_9FABA|nr:unnamed protein product [Sphenostylis stenocarpa]
MKATEVFVFLWIGHWDGPHATREAIQLCSNTNKSGKINARSRVNNSDMAAGRRNRLNE